MIKMIKIIDELNLENGSNYKKEVLTKHKDNELLQRVLKMTYDRVTFTYGITMKNVDIESQTIIDGEPLNLSQMLDSLEDYYCTRQLTGNAAIEGLSTLLSQAREEDAKVLEMIINRDLRINLGKTHINKVFKNLIVKPPYMRCSLADKLDRITYPAIVQTKADGSYRSLIIDNGEVTLMGRSGEQDDFPMFFNKVSTLPDGVYIGELLIRSLPGAKNRMKANGLINSDVEQEDMFLQTWDYLTLQEWNEKKSIQDYWDRLVLLEQNIKNCPNEIELIEGKIVNSYEEAMEFYKVQTNKGLEGAVLKNLDTPFKDHTSPTQIKLKEEAVSEVIITGYQEGEGRLVGTLGAMYYVSSDGLVEGKMGGFNDETRKEIWDNQEKYSDTIVSVKYNGVTKAKGKDTFALMFANFVEFRPEKDEADNLKYIQDALK